MKTRFGIIGLGHIGSKMATDLGNSSAGQLYGVAARDVNKAESFAKQYGAEKVYADYDALIHDADIDVVYIATTNDTHYNLVKKCLEMGKPVLCEKPMVTNKAQAIELAELARSKNTLLVEAMWTRFNPVYNKAKEWIAEGKIGKVSLVNASFCFNSPFNPASRLYNKELGGGAIFDVGVYVIAFALGILGEKPEEVTAAINYAQTGVDDFAAISMKYPSGAVAGISCGLTSTIKRDAYIYGSDGYVYLEEFWHPASVKVFNNSGEITDSFSIQVSDRFNYQIEHICELINNGKTESDLMPLDDTIEVAGIFDKLLKNKDF